MCMMEFDKRFGRTIMISEAITEDVAHDVVWRITRINEIDDENFMTFRDYEHEPIKIIINSPGGDVYSGMAIIDAIQNSTTPVITIGTGICASMGLGILVSGHERYATKRTQFMYHDISGGVWGNPKDIKAMHEHMEKLAELYDQLMRETTKFPVDEIRQKHVDYWFDAEEARKYSVIDGIIMTWQERKNLIEKKLKPKKTNDNLIDEFKEFLKYKGLDEDDLAMVLKGDDK